MEKIYWTIFAVTSLILPSIIISISYCCIIRSVRQTSSRVKRIGKLLFDFFSFPVFIYAFQISGAYVVFCRFADKCFYNNTDSQSFG